MTPDDPSTPTPAQPDPPTLTKGAADGEPLARRPRPMWRGGDGSALAGVAEGLGRYTGRDPALFRAGFVALTFVFGLGLVLYLALVLTLPTAEGRPSMLAAGLRSRGRLRSIAGLSLVTLGMLVLASGAVPVTILLVWFGAIVLRKLPEAGPAGPPVALEPRAPVPA